MHGVWNEDNVMYINCNEGSLRHYIVITFLCRRAAVRKPMKKNSMAPVKDGSPTVRVVCSTVSLFPNGEPQPPSNGWAMQINAGYNQPQVDSNQESDVVDDDYQIPGRRFEVDRGETRLNPSSGGLDRQLNAGYDQPDVYMSDESENVYIDPVIPVDVNRGKVGTHQYANGLGMVYTGEYANQCVIDRTTNYIDMSCGFRRKK